MFNSLLEALGWPGLVLAALVALYLITRVPWWGARVCVPNAEAVEAVQREAPGWRRYGWSWIISFPPLDVISFFAALLWPVMVALKPAAAGAGAGEVLPRRQPDRRRSVRLVHVFIAGGWLAILHFPDDVWNCRRAGGQRAQGLGVSVHDPAVADDHWGNVASRLPGARN